MDRTTSRKQARAKVVERQREAAAAREARERANIGDLTEFTVQAAKVDDVAVWLAEKTASLNAEAERRRSTHRQAAGSALQRMRLRGETIPAIAEAAGVSIGRVREFLKSAARASSGGEPEVAVPAAGVSPPPTPAGPVTDGRAAGGSETHARDAVIR